MVQVKKIDMVNHPPHYEREGGGPECIDWIEMCLTSEEFRGYLRGCALKYTWRYKNKCNPKEDLEKAQWYLNKLAEKEPTLTTPSVNGNIVLNYQPNSDADGDICLETLDSLVSNGISSHAKYSYREV